MQTKNASDAPKTVREQVTKLMRDELIAGTFEAGTMLREVQLAERFQVSRGPVRDAFIQLSHEGYLSYHTNRGVMVRQPPDTNDREFITSLRQQIEIHVIKTGFSNISDAGIEQVEVALSNLKEACESADTTQIALKDIEFHETIIVICGGEDLVGAWRQLCSRMLLSYSRHKDFHEAYEEHFAIFAALRNRQLKRTIAALKANIK